MIFNNPTRAVAICLIVMAHALQTQAQRDKASEVAGAAAIIGGIAAGAFSIHQYREMLETEALNHLIASHPEASSFELKILDLEGKKASDIGSLSVLTFQITELERQTGREIGRSVLMMFTSNGWLTEFGIDLNYVSWKRLEQKEWNQLLAAFAELSSATDINENLIFRESESIKSKEYDIQNPNHYELRGDFYNRTENVYMIPEIYFTKKGLSAASPSSDGTIFTRLILPFIPLKNDEYLVTQYSEDYQLVANEKALGLFLNNTQQTIQLQRTLVAKIHGFLNNRKAYSY